MGLSKSSSSFMAWRKFVVNKFRARVLRRVFGKAFEGEGLKTPLLIWVSSSIIRSSRILKWDQCAGIPEMKGRYRLAF